MWKKYFGPFAQIIGIEIKEKLNDFEGIGTRWNGADPYS